MIVALRRAGGGALGVLVVMLLAVPGARAGMLTAVENISTGQGCGLFVVNSTAADSDARTCGPTWFGVQTISDPLPMGTVLGFETVAPAGIMINSASVTGMELYGVNNGTGWDGGSYFSGGGTLWYDYNTTQQDTGFSSPYWGFNIGCNDSVCGNGSMLVGSVSLTATENTGPTLDALGSGNLYYQQDQGHWVWNPPGDPWPIPLSANDPSGVCSMSASVGGGTIDGPSATPNTGAWQQCPEPTWSTPTVDTTTYIPTSGTLPISYSATNAAQMTTQSPVEDIHVDNDPVTVALSTPNDPNATLWVNHAVTVDATASAGPSGVSGVNCSVDGGASTPYPTGGMTVNGNGTHTVSCTASNNAVDPQGNPNTGTSAEMIKVDEAPPSVSFEPLDPSDPTRLVANTADSESGDAGGTITMTAPGSSTPVALPTTFTGSQLVANFDDAGLHGAYTFTANSCDNVGNCASTSETLTLPVRLASTSDISFRTIESPAKIVRKRVRIDGRLKRIRVVIPVNEACATKRVRLAKHHWREIRACRVLKLNTETRLRARFGAKVHVHGLLVSSQGAPLADAPVVIETAPDERGGQYRPVASATTSASGTWSATLPLGPSRVVHAVYPGSNTVLPATGIATLTVPARISLSITPHKAPWSGYIRIRGHLDGGYIPSDGVALRLLARYPGSQQATPLQALRTDRHGRFSFTWSYHSGRGAETIPFSIATTATESDYPFAAGSSRAIRIAFG